MLTRVLAIDEATNDLCVVWDGCESVAGEEGGREMKENKDRQTHLLVQSLLPGAATLAPSPIKPRPSNVSKVSLEYLSLSCCPGLHYLITGLSSNQDSVNLPTGITKDSSLYKMAEVSINNFQITENFNNLNPQREEYAKSSDYHLHRE